MTDTFEEWLEKEAGRVSKKVMGQGDTFDNGRGFRIGNKVILGERQGDTFDNGREQAYLLSLRKYREFLKKQSEKAAPYDITNFYPENTDTGRIKSEKRLK